MQQPLPFDPDVYFAIVADTLIRNHGAKALDFADHALRKMRDIGDTEGFDLWLGVHEQLSSKAARILIEPDAPIH